MKMVKIAENTWKVGECTLKKTRGCWYAIDPMGGMAGFTTRKVALQAIEHWNADWAERNADRS